MADVTASAGFESAPSPEAEMDAIAQAQAISQALEEYTRYKKAGLSPEQKAAFFKDFPGFEAIFAELDKSPEASPFSLDPERMQALMPHVDPTETADIFATRPGFGTRVAVKNLMNSIPDAINYLQDKFPGHAFIESGGDIYSKPVGGSEPWRPMDPSFMESIFKPAEMGRDVLEGTPDVAAGIAKQGAGLLAGGAAAAVNPALAPVGYAAGTAAAGGVENALRQALGRAMGINKGFDPVQMGTQAAIEGGVGAAFGGVPAQALLKSKGGSLATLKSLVPGMGGGDLQGTLSPGQRQAFEKAVKAKLGLTSEQYALMHDADIAKLLEDKMQGIIPQLQSRLLKPTVIGGASGITGIPAPNLKEYLSLSGTEQDLLKDENVRGMFLNRMKGLAKSLHASGKQRVAKLYDEAAKVMEKEGTSTEEIFDKLKELYRGHIQASQTAKTAEAGTSLQAAQDLRELTKYMLNRDLAGAPRSALNKDMFFQRSTGQWLPKNLAKEAGAFNVTGKELAQLKSRLEDVGKPVRLNVGEQKPPASAQTIGDIKQLLAVMQGATPEEQQVAAKAAGEMYDLERGAKKLISPKAKESGPLNVSTFLSRASQPKAVESQAMQDFAKLTQQTGKAADKEAYQALAAGIQKQKAYEAATGRIGGGAPRLRGFREQMLPIVNALYKTGKGVGDIADFAGRYGGTHLLSPMWNQPPQESMDPEWNAELMRRIMNLNQSEGQ